MTNPADIGKALQEEITKLKHKEEEHQKTIQALKEEFSQCNDSGAIAQVARNAIVRIMPKAIAQLETLIQTAESESVRASLAKFVVATGLDKSKFEDNSDTAIRTLLSQLTANDPLPDTTDQEVTPSD